MFDRTSKKMGFIPGLKKISLTVGIAVLFALFIGFTIDAFYEGPNYEDYCDNNYYSHEKPVMPTVDYTCPPLNYSQPVYEECIADKGYVAYETDDYGCATTAYCETCQVDFDAANKVYSRNLFFITAILGIAALLIGLMYISLEAIASGFMFGGILVLIYGTIRVFGDLSKEMRVVVLGLELIILVYLGIRKSKK